MNEDNRKMSIDGLDFEFPKDRRKKVVLDRRDHPLLDEALIEMIAEKAAEKAILKMEDTIYKNVGKTFVDKMTYLLGAFLIALAYFLNQKGFLTFNK